MRLAVASLNQTPLDFSGNTERIRCAVAQANKERAKILILPCDAIIGFDAKRHHLCADFRAEVKKRERQLQKESAMPLIFGNFNQRAQSDFSWIEVRGETIPFRLHQDFSFSSSKPIIARAAPLGYAGGNFLYDGVSWIGVRGKILAQTAPFSFREVNVITASIASAKYTNKTSREYDYAFAADKSTAKKSPKENIVDYNFTMFSRAIALGLYDYLRKSGARKFVLSLSGGADSAAVAMLVHLMVRFGIGDLGIVKFCESLRLVPPQSFATEKAKSSAAEKITAQLLLSVYQATPQNSHTTRNAARQVAALVGAEHHELEIQPQVELYTLAAEKIIGRKMSWERDAAALQNIQARARSPMAWLLANLKSAILLCTSNRSEATLGYCTMDGDTSGGFAPLAGIDKAFLRRYLGWLERDGIVIDNQRYTFPKLSCITQQEPTAELLPLPAQQRDERDLMPYSLLNIIEKLVIGKNLSPREVIAHLLPVEKLHAELLKEWLPNKPRAEQEAQIKTWVARFFQLWQRNQWKQTRYAPGFTIDGSAPTFSDFADYPSLSSELVFPIFFTRDDNYIIP